jgi:hypothetical protein
MGENENESENLTNNPTMSQYNNPFSDVPSASKMPPPDERRGAPSASGMDRLCNCPASFAMERENGVDMESDDAASGTRIHNALAGLLPYEDLTLPEQETHDMCAEQAERLISEFIQIDNVSGL